MAVEWVKRLVLVAMVFVAVVASLGGAGAQDAAASVEQQLVDRYLPVIYVREHEFTCARPPEQGEPYLPIPVEMVLGNQRVLLRDGATNDMVIGEGVDAVELARHGEDTYLDFPGDPRQPGCTYETDERIRAEELGFTPTTYARIVVVEEEGRLALQYWFFWYFNEWNNTHEADWEMIQIMWDEAGTVEEALAREPSRTAFSQHSAGERGTWGDDKIELEDGTHPTIFSAAGSHASFYSSRTFLQWGENNSGFGCDLTTGPSTRVDLTAKLVQEPIDPQGEFAWLLYPGRWGERQISVFNGVNGPGYNDRWIDPWVSTDNWPDRNIVVPTSQVMGPTATSAFCSIASTGSQLLIFAKVHPWVAIPAISLVAAAVFYLYQRSRDIFRRAIKVYRNNWRVFAGIGLVAIPIGIVFNLIEAFTVRRSPIEPIVQWLGDTAGAELSWVLAVGGIQQLAMLLVIGPAVIQAVADIHQGRTPSVVRSYRMAIQRLGTVLVAGLLMVVLVGIPLLVVIGLPIAVWLIVRWQYFGQALMFDKETGSIGSLKESARLVDGRWWRTAFAALLFDLLATVPGVVVGFGLLTVGRVAVGFANAASSLLYALLIPLSVIALTVMFLDRRGDPIVVQGIEGGTEPAPGYSRTG
jgi:hypothetical protein